MDCLLKFIVLFVSFWIICSCGAISNIGQQENNFLTNEESFAQDKSRNNKTATLIDVGKSAKSFTSFDLRQSETKKRETPWQTRRHPQGYEPPSIRPDHSPYPSGPGYSSYGGNGYGVPHPPHNYDEPPKRFGHDGYDDGEYIGGHHEYGHEIHEYGGTAGSGHGFGHGDVGYGNNKGLALKKVLLPLAGLAILGAVAALSTNPVLLQLGSIGGRKRRRRSVSTRKGYVYPANPKLKPT